NAATGAFTYTPAQNYNGPDGFTFKANDGFLDSNTVAVSITVTPVNDPPAATNDAATTDEDTPATGNLLANDTDVDGDTLTVVTVNGLDTAVGTSVVLGS